ncbi:Nramp family divalent metal transporter [Lentiprolixibacter aurantiacus]|uniref:Nramp family divalent metal transporter n=1 Tax=Lentiprolixibacter aurantiacus TaxID=2993939 RepID=A0AAE3ML36_9FLAO|nr:Nramp family divalent metal transporter [Lentiprolixibacter aurantiacus]MCX2719711.1 Nramp family divalent metal transporter [Lentiprolixibacter aurantiacus]
MFRKLGPGVLVAAAFIGPGTVTLCTLAGARFGFTLLWALLLSVIATIVLQEMAARLGIITGQGLADSLFRALKTPWKKVVVVILILGAIVIGNTAYEAGNIGGAVLGLEALFGREYLVWYPWIIGLLAFLLLYRGSYKFLERVFVGLVILMSISFLLTAIITKPDISGIFRGLLVPELPEGGLLTVVGLIGTTVVPYNLFLHASLVKEKWSKENDLVHVRRDAILSIGIGGLISMAIVIVAVAIPEKHISGALDLAKGLEPLYGNAARYFMGIGLFAAGVTSAITAPLAAAYVADSCFRWKAGLKDYRFRGVWMFVLLMGALSLTLEFKPIEIIKFAQVTNGLLLPAVAGLMLWIVNQSDVMGNYTNKRWQNGLALIILVLVLLLGLKSIAGVFGVLS